MLGKTFAEKQRERKGDDYDYDVAKLKRRIAELEAALREIESRTSAYAGDDQNWPLASGVNDVARKALRSK